jgi:nitrogen fixation/metabolism regulation signal transduction histidine kinase
MSPSASLRSQVIKKSLDDKQARTNETVNEYEDAEKNYQPKTIKFWLPLIGMYLALFLVALVSYDSINTCQQVLTF